MQDVKVQFSLRSRVLLRTLVDLHALIWNNKSGSERNTSHSEQKCSSSTRWPRRCTIQSHLRTVCFLLRDNAKKSYHKRNRRTNSCEVSNQNKAFAKRESDLSLKTDEMAIENCYGKDVSPLRLTALLPFCYLPFLYASVEDFLAGWTMIIV